MPRASKSHPKIPKDASLRFIRTCCRRSTCKVCGGKSQVHGPYWYARWTDETGRARTHYFGKELPAEVAVARLKTVLAKSKVRIARDDFHALDALEQLATRVA